MALWTWDDDGELEGKFWLPSQDDQFYGRLTHDRHDGPRFHFFGCEREELAGGQRPRPRGLTLFGDSPEHGALTVRGFFGTNFTEYAGRQGADVVDGFANSVLAGTHLAADEPLEAPLLTTDVHGLRETLIGGLVGPGLLNPHHQRSESDWDKGEGLGIDLDDGTNLYFFAGERPHLSRHTRSVDVHASLQVTANEPTDADQLEERYVEPIRELVSFSTRRPSHIRHLALHYEDPHATVSVLRRPWPRPNREERRLDRLALNLAEVADPAALLRRWLALRDQVGPVWILFFATIDPEYGYLDNRFLNLMAFAEGYHRAIRDQPPLTPERDREAREAVKGALTGMEAREIYLQRLSHANSQSQRERLLELAEAAANLLSAHWRFDARSACRSMVDTRNWMTHWSSRSRHVDSEPPALVQFCRQLELILYIAILRDLELLDDEIADAIRSGWTIEGLP